MDINVIAGRAGSGKSKWARESMMDELHNIRNAVVFIGKEEDGVRSSFPGFYKRVTHFERGVAEALALLAGNKEKGDIRVSLYIDLGNFIQEKWQRDLIKLAADAGVAVNVLVQSFAQFDMGDIEWLYKNCSCSIISKGKPPRVASKEEIETKYR